MKRFLLINIFLFSLCLNTFAQLTNTVIVNGNTFGTWRKDTIYLVTGNSTVQASRTLTIEPGTQIRFKGNYSLNVIGKLNAIGSVELPIKFTSDSTSPRPADWQGITLQNGANTIQHTIIEYCSSCINDMSSSSNVISNNQISNFDYAGIYLDWRSLSDISNNTIYDFNGYGIFNQAYGIGNKVIDCNYIYNGTIYGIYSRYTGNITNNVIHNIVGTDTSAGICFGINSQPIENNYVDSCYIGLYRSQFGVNHFQKILNNTFRNNSKAGLFFTASSDSGQVTNNIFSNNAAGIHNDGSSNINHTISYNLFNRNGSDFANIPTTGLGQIIGQNSQNNNIDAYNNVFANPLFLNSNSPVLTTNSPAWNAGNNNTDIGFNPYVTCFSWDYEGLPSDTVSSDTTSLAGTVHAGSSYLTSGKVIATNLTTLKTYEIGIDINGTFLLDSLPAGTYKLYAVPFTPFNANYSTTYYPNKANESNATVLTVTGHIYDLDVYLVSPTTAVNDHQAPPAALKSYPNPFSSQLTIVSDKYTDTPTDIQVLNLQGLVVKELQQTFNGNKLTLELGNLPAGIYAIRLSSTTNNDIFKVVKQ